MRCQMTCYAPVTYNKARFNYLEWSRSLFVKIISSAKVSLSRWIRVT